MRKVAIIGVGALPFSSRYKPTFRALALEAAKKAFDDCGLSPKDIDTVVWSIYCETMLRQQIPNMILHDYLGMQGKGGLRVEAGAATDGYALNAAYAQIASGLCDVVLLSAVQKGGDFYSFETGSRGDGLLKGFSISNDVTWLQPVVPGVPPFLTTVCLVPHIEKYGNPTPEQLARISVKNYNNAYTNPDAQLHMKVTIEDILNSRIIAWPTTARMCCLMSDGAVALILASEERAKEISEKPIWITGTATSTYCVNCSDEKSIGRLLGTHIAAKKAYDMAGIKNPMEELDLIEVHDLISGLEILIYEELGLCEPGEGGRLIDEGIVEKEGPLPSNPSGGRIACGHVAGVSAAYSAYQVVLQLREEAVGTQVKIRQGKGLVQCNDGNAANSSVSILQREY